MFEVYLAGWLTTLGITCWTPVSNRNVLGDAIASVMLLVWPLFWLVAIASMIIRIRDRKRVGR